MPSFSFNATPADVRWPVIRGDDPAMPIFFFDAHTSHGDPVDVPRDLTGYTFASRVATGRGGTVVATPTVTVVSAALGQISVSMTDTQTDALANSTYIWDLIQNPGTTTETTLITGRMTVAGRATP